MKKLSTICALVLILSLIKTSSFAVQFCKDFLEGGNPGGFGSCDTSAMPCSRDADCPMAGETCVSNSLKSFDETIVVEETDRVFVDIWINDLTHSTPEGLCYAAFKATWDSSITVVAVKVYDSDYDGNQGTHEGTTSAGLPGLWDAGITRTTLTSNSVVVKAGQIASTGASCDSTGDIPLAQLEIHCKSLGLDQMQIDTVPGFVSVVSGVDYYEYDDKIIPNTFTIRCGSTPVTTTTTTPSGTTTSTSAISSTSTTSTLPNSTTSSSSSTTTISLLWPRAYQKMWGFKKEENLSLLRAFRDEVLVDSEVGRNYLCMLYNNSLEVLTLLIRNPSLTEETKEGIDKLLPKIQSVLDGGEMIFSKRQLASIESLLTRFESEATPGLKTAIKKVRRDIRAEKVFKQLRINIVE